MSRLKVGDTILVLLKGGKLVNPYSDFEEKVKLDIIGVDGDLYYCYLPQNFVCKESFICQSFDVKILKVNKKYIGDQILAVKESMIFNVVSVLDGMICLRCQEFVAKAQPNCNNDFICWSCRNNPYR